MQEQSSGIRIGAYLMLHALFWTFAMILADYIWGDSVAKWMAVVFGIVNGLVAIVVVTKIARASNAADQN